MSRIGRKPLEIPKGVTVSITGEAVSTKGPKGTLTLKRHKDIEIKQTKDDDKKDVIVFERTGNLGSQRAAHGLMRALVGNMLTGVTQGFTRQLEINGVGYKAEIKGTKVVLSLGFSHPIEYKAPKGITLSAPQPTQIVIDGADKEIVGQVAAEIRSLRPPEPYKGKGVKYQGEQIRRKAGKAGGK